MSETGWNLSAIPGLRPQRACTAGFLPPEAREGRVAQNIYDQSDFFYGYT